MVEQMDRERTTSRQERDDDILLSVFAEIGIIQQLATLRLERVLPQGLLLPHFLLLHHLMRVGDGRSMSSLAAAFQVTKATMTNTVKRLTERGLVDVRADPNDRRTKRVYVTEAGRAMRAEALQAMLPSMRTVGEIAGMDSFEALQPDLNAMRAALEAVRDWRSNDPAPRTLFSKAETSEAEPWG